MNDAGRGGTKAAAMPPPRGSGWRAWSSIAVVDCQEGDPDAALKALDRAGDALRGRPSLAHDVAMVAVVRARALHALRRNGEALGLLDDAWQLFSEFGDAGMR